MQKFPNVRCENMRWMALVIRSRVKSKYHGISCICYVYLYIDHRPVFRGMTIPKWMDQWWISSNFWQKTWYIPVGIYITVITVDWYLTFRLYHTTNGSMEATAVFLSIPRSAVLRSSSQPGYHPRSCSWRSQRGNLSRSWALSISI